MEKNVATILLEEQREITEKLMNVLDEFQEKTGFIIVDIKPVYNSIQDGNVKEQSLINIGVNIALGKQIINK